MEETPGRASLEKLGCRTPPQLHAGGVGRQQQHISIYYYVMVFIHILNDNTIELSIQFSCAMTNDAGKKTFINK